MSQANGHIVVPEAVPSILKNYVKGEWTLIVYVQIILKY